MKLDDAMTVADAVLFEGYALYPYRASSAKNRYRWQFGCSRPAPGAKAAAAIPWWQETQCLVAPADQPVRIQGLLRFMRLCRREAGRPAQGTPLGRRRDRAGRIPGAAGSLHHGR